LAGRDQEDQSSKPALAKSSRDPIPKILNNKTGLAEWLKWESTYLASVRPLVQTPVQLINK
jgi:hypothetical protein